MAAHAGEVARMQQQQQLPQLSGDVVQKREGQVQQTGQQHTVVLLRTDEGRQIAVDPGASAVDMGLVENIEGLSRKQGQPITFLAAPVQTSDRLLLFVTHVRSGNQNVPSKIHTLVMQGWEFSARDTQEEQEEMDEERREQYEERYDQDWFQAVVVHGECARLGP